MKKIIIFIIFVGIVATAGLFLNSQKEVVATQPTPQRFHYNVAIQRAQTKSVRETRPFLAQLLASKSALIASKFSADIKKVYVKENDMVKKGQRLIALDDAEMKANIASLKQQKRALSIDVDNTKRALGRSKKLYEAEAISQEKYDNTNVLYQNKVAAVESTNEKIKQLHAQLKYLNITAPFSGRIGTIFVDAGNLAIPGKPIVSLNSDDQKLVFSYVETAQAIVEGQKVMIDKHLIGMVSRRYDDARNAMLVAEVKLNLPLPYANKAFLNIDVVVAETKGCSVPLNALLHRKNKTVLMVYKENHFEPFIADVILQDDKDAILTSCPSVPFATASEAKLALLPTLGNIILNEEE